MILIWSAVMRASASASRPVPRDRAMALIEEWADAIADSAIPPTNTSAAIRTAGYLPLSRASIALPSAFYAVAPVSSRHSKKIAAILRRRQFARRRYE